MQDMGAASRVRASARASGLQGVAAAHEGTCTHLSERVGFQESLLLMMADARTAERVRALAPLPTAENCWDSLVGLPRPAVRFCLALLAACINERREEAESTGSENRGRHA